MPGIVLGVGLANERRHYIVTGFQWKTKFDQNLECSGPKYAQPIMMKFCMPHDSVTVVTHAKFCCDQRNIFHGILNSIEISFVGWAPATSLERQDVNCLLCEVGSICDICDCLVWCFTAYYSTHRGWVTNICLDKLVQHCFRSQFVTRSVPKHYSHQCCLVNWKLRNKFQWNS